jgi:hypothetical protein
MRKILMLFACLVMLYGQLHAQSRTITGRITDEAGAGLAGASIVAKGTTIGTTSGADGSFSLSVPATARTLVISFQGFTLQEQSIGTRTSIDVTLKATGQNLEEVVVVGYGTQRRTDVTGSIAQINGNKLRDQPIQSFEQGLSGRAAGVNISIPNGVLNNPPVIRVRGVNSISLSSFPLVVIDGVPAFTGNTGGTASNNVLGDINPCENGSGRFRKIFV